MLGSGPPKAFMWTLHEIVIGLMTIVVSEIKVVLGSEICYGDGVIMMQTHLEKGTSEISNTLDTSSIYFQKRLPNH